MKAYHYQFQSDYLEFYLMESRALDAVYFPWPKAAVENNLWVLEGAIGIRNYPSMDVKTHLTVEVHEERPPLASGDWGRINECSLNLQQGALGIAVHGWHGCGRDIPIEPGRYRARVYYGTQSALEEEFAAHGHVRGREEFKIQLWEEPLAEFVVLKVAPAVTVPRQIPPVFCHKNAD